MTTVAFDESKFEVVKEPTKDVFDSSNFELVDTTTESREYRFDDLSPTGKTLDVIGGVAETIPALVGGFVASAPAAVVGGFNAFFGEDGTAGERYMSGYQGAHEAIAKAIPYRPETATGKSIEETIGKVFEYLPEKAGKTTFEATGSPALATAAKTAVAGAELVLPFMIGRKKSNVPKEFDVFDTSRFETVKPDVQDAVVSAQKKTVEAQSIKPDEVVPLRGEIKTDEILPERQRETITNDDIAGKPELATEREAIISGKPEDISLARQEATKTVEGLFREEPKSGTTFYSGLPVEEIGVSIKRADTAIRDGLGIPDKDIGIKLTEKETTLSPLDFLKSPRKIAEKFPDFAPFKEKADTARIIQDTLRDVFERRLKEIDLLLGGGTKILDLGKSYRQNKMLLREITLTEDFLGKRFTSAELASEFNASPKVISAHKLLRAALDHAWGIGAKTREIRGKDIPGYREGYVPHIFHDYFIKIDGKIVGSERTFAKAVATANKLKRSGGKVDIVQKQFEFPGEKLQAVLVGDSQYFALKNGIEKAFTLSADEATAIMNDLAMRRGRSRFVGNFLQRKGAEGWDKNLDYAIPHYLNMISRYAAMDRFKSEAISRFENSKTGFGPFDKEYTGIAGYTKAYINDVLGVPTKIESALNSLIKDNRFFNAILGKYLGERPALQLAAGANKAVTIAAFGFANVSAGLVNLFQLHMGWVLLGTKWTSVGLERAAPIIKAAAERKLGLESKTNPDIGILRQLDVEIQQGLESSSGYSKFGEMSDLASKTLFLWKAAEWENRAVVGLGAYYKGLSLGMEKPEALAYARGINTKVNFDYSVQDAPALFRRSGPPGSMLLQFKKFPIKAIEFMSELKGAEHARFWVPLFILAGLYAFPGIEAMKNLVKSMTGIDAELETKKALMNWAGEDQEKQAIAKTIFYGAFANEELAGIDISHRLGTGDFIPSRASDFMGPFFSKTVRAIQLSSQGDVKEAIRAVSPGLGNPILAVTEEKVTSPTNRDRLVTTLNEKERALKAVGFRTSKEAVETDKARVISYETKKYNENKKEAIDDLIESAISKDADAIKKASDRIKELQIDITKENIKNEILQKNLTPSQRAYLSAPSLVKGKTKEAFKFK